MGAEFSFTMKTTKLISALFQIYTPYHKCSINFLLCKQHPSQDNITGTSPLTVPPEGNHYPDFLLRWIWLVCFDALCYMKPYMVCSFLCLTPVHSAVWERSVLLCIIINLFAYFFFPSQSFWKRTVLPHNKFSNIWPYFPHSMGLRRKGWCFRHPEGRDQGCC